MPADIAASKPAGLSSQHQTVGWRHAHPTGRLQEHVWERLTSFDLFTSHNDRKKVFKSNRFQCSGDNGQNSSGGYRYLRKSSDLAREIRDFRNRPNRVDSLNVELLLFVCNRFRIE